MYRDGHGEQVLVDLVELGDRLTIGRRTSNDIVLEWDAEVSRIHAALERVGFDWLIADDGLSRNGTWVNGNRLTGHQLLRDGDVLTVGTTALAFVAPTSEPSQPTATARGPHVGSQLTPAQRRVIVALCRPYASSPYGAPASNREIADELVVSVDAVKRNLRALFAIFGVDDLPQNRKRAALAEAALRTGAVARRDL
ncbi:MAG TPA: FHA domain-containing protein [Solirubrobacteraceae bacterium]|nr:FHA domain-containing protein [Solirubrobacteraceae bacterium]